MRFPIFVLLLGMTSPSLAQNGDEGDCRNGGFPMENRDFGVAKVVAARAYFLSDTDGCPGAEPRCRQKSYVIRGNEVLTGRAKGPYICAYFPNRLGGAAGWIDQKLLKPLPIDRNPPLSAWPGWWSDFGNPFARISRQGNTLYLKAEAWWPGPERERDWPPGWPHSGGSEGKFIPKGNQAHFSSDGCEVDFTLAGKYIIAADNGQCGGANVRLNGIYQRSKPASFTY